MDEINIHSCNVDVNALEAQIRRAAPKAEVNVRRTMALSNTAPEWINIAMTVLSPALTATLVELIKRHGKEKRVRTRIVVKQLDASGKVVGESATELTIDE
jgi:hypothetical protein